MRNRGSGAYDRRGVVERLKADAAENEQGEIDRDDDDNWEEYARRWSKIVARGTREFWNVDQVDANVTHLLHFLYDSKTLAMTSAMRFRVGTKLYEFVGVNELIEDTTRVVQVTAIERKV